MEEKKHGKISKGIFFIMVLILSTISFMVYFETNLFTSFILGLVVTFIIFLFIKYTPKKEKKGLEIEELEKLSSEEIRKRLEENKDFDVLGRGILDKRKDYKTKELIGECFNDILTFSIPILFFGLILMGALGNIADIPKEDFMNNSTRNVMMAANVTLNTFFDIGYESSHPYTYLFLFYLAVFMAFFYPVIVLIYRLIIREERKGNDN